MQQGTRDGSLVVIFVVSKMVGRSQRRLYLDGAELARELPIAEVAFSRPSGETRNPHVMKFNA
jgi:hypothetical protein